MKTVQQNISLTTNADNKYTLYLLALLLFFFFAQLLLLAVYNKRKKIHSIFITRHPSANNSTYSWRRIFVRRTPLSFIIFCLLAQPLYTMMQVRFPETFRVYVKTELFINWLLFL